MANKTANKDVEAATPLNSFQSKLNPKGIHLCSGVGIKKTLHADHDELCDWEICPNLAKANIRMSHIELGN